jgi:hypothetical protein
VPDTGDEEAAARRSVCRCNRELVASITEGRQATGLCVAWPAMSTTTMYAPRHAIVTSLMTLLAIGVYLAWGVV